MNRLVRAQFPLFLLIGGLLAIPPLASAQSPWTLNRSGFFFQNTILYQSSESFFTETGAESSFADNSKFKDFTNSFYLEYGIRDKFGLVLSLPIKSLKTEFGGSQPDLSNTGFGDMTIGLRYKLLDGAFVGSFQGDLTFPTGYNTSISKPPLGDGVTDVSGRLLLGKSLWPLKGYVQGGLGYRSRFENQSSGANFRNQILYNVEAGYWFINKLLLIGRFGGNKATGSGTSKDEFGWNLSAQYRISDFVTVSTGFFDPIGGSSTVSGIKLGLGISFRGNQLGKYEGALSSTLEDPEQAAAEASTHPAAAEASTPPAAPPGDVPADAASPADESETTDPENSGDTDPGSGTTP